MSKSSKYVTDWRKRTKIRIVQAMGGCCVCCGYNKHPEVLQLHHLNPDEKEFELSSLRANPKKWTKIVEELRKCVLLCANCHTEVEYCDRDIPQDAQRFNEVFADYDRLRTTISLGIVTPEDQINCVLRKDNNYVLIDDEGTVEEIRTLRY